MNSEILAPNILIAAMGAVGILVVFWSITMRANADLRRADVLSGRVKPEASFLEKLDLQLRQAELGVTAGEFVRTSVILGAAFGLVAWLATDAPAAGLAGFFVGGVGYWSYLTDRRDQMRADFQDALADTVGLLIEAYESGSALEEAFRYVAQHGPAIVRGDFEDAIAQLNTGKPREQVLTMMSEKRRDPVLDVIVESLLVQVKQGGHAVELLRGLQESVRARVSLRTRIRAEQESPKWEIRLTTGFIFLTVVFARITNPAYGAFWRTPVGSISLFVAFGLAVAGFFIANQVLASSTRTEESFGVAEPGQPEAVAPTDMHIAGRAA